MSARGAEAQEIGTTPPGPREVLQEGLSRWLGRPVRVVAWSSRPLETSSHPIHRLQVTLDTGEQVPVVFKRLRPGHKLYGNEREVLIYRRLLGGRRFGAPALYASALDEALGRYWLFLEDVGKRTLGEVDVDGWLAAVRWLAGMHAAYQGREEELRALGCLGEHGAEYYRAVAQVARQHLREAASGEALARFDSLMGGFDAVAAYLAGQPRTLVHGDIFADNLVVEPGLRIRPIDWESASVGLGAWDLTRLVDGWGSDTPTFVAAYRAEFARHAGVPPEEGAFRRTLAHCQVLNVLWHLRWSVDACRDAAFVQGRLHELEKVWRGLNERGSHV